MASDIQKESHELHPFLKLKNHAGTEDVYYSATYENLPSEFKTIAQKELNETEENQRKGIKKLSDYLKKENVSGIDYYTLLLVLRCCKYNLKKSEAKMKSYLKARSMILEKLKNMDLKKFENVLDNCGAGILPYRDKRGSMILFTTPNVKWDLYDTDDGAFCFTVLCLFSLTFPLTSVAGISYIAECKTSTPSVFYPIVKSARTAVLTVPNLPLRVAKVDIINEISILRYLYNVIRPLLPRKIAERVSFNGSEIANVKKHYHSDILPNEFGGTMGPMNPKLYKDNFMNFVQKLKTESLK